MKFDRTPAWPGQRLGETREDTRAREAADWALMVVGFILFALSILEAFI